MISKVLSITFKAETSLQLSVGEQSESSQNQERMLKRAR